MLSVKLSSVLIFTLFTILLFNIFTLSLSDSAENNDDTEAEDDVPIFVAEFGEQTNEPQLPSVTNANNNNQQQHQQQHARQTPQIQPTQSLQLPYKSSSQLEPVILTDGNFFDTVVESRQP